MKEIQVLLVHPDGRQEIVIRQVEETADESALLKEPSK